ncbi:hypothetical protein ES332_A06G183000v1 [Gossypium tomentosum]|uniref:Cystatin domain-containing protein n=1 Tax=Gossypium tomentosum TaxID=34277 RepID=A0A5D2Q5D5_GOSTO|nr:hypothetical protein ES332_A06G183000v1 [Gossypium tomentosum]
MQQIFCFLILLLSILFLPIIFSDARKDALDGGWTPIKDIKDPHVTEIAVKSETQVVSGINYKLVLKAKDGSAVNTYEAVVWEKAWLHFRNLTSFTLVMD